MEQSRNKLTNEPIINFSHNYQFMVINFIKITSIRIENFRASLGRRPGGEQSFVWGRYNLLIYYQVYDGKKEILKSKEFSRGFSFALNDCILHVEEVEEMVGENLRSDFSFSHGVRPISFGLLPLLSKINNIPFKIDVNVKGAIIKGRLTTDMEEKSLLRGELTCEDSSKNKSVQREKPLPELQEEKLAEAIPEKSFKKEIDHKSDLISREKKKKAAVPSLDPQYYKKHQLFFDYFFHNRPQDKKRNE